MFFAEVMMLPASNEGGYGTDETAHAIARMVAWRDL